MHSQWTWKGSHQDEEIEDLLQELARLKLRLSKIERRENLSSLGRNCNGVRGKYAATTASRSPVPTKFVRTEDDEGISEDQIISTYKEEFERPPHQSSIPPSIEFSFEEFEDSFSKSSYIPLYNEPVYDVYEEDMFIRILDFGHSAHDNDESKKNPQSEFFMHKATNVLAITESNILSLGNQQLASGEKTCAGVQCNLCSDATGAFHKSTNEEWIHAFCDECLLESTYKRCQQNLVEEIEAISKEKDIITCCICHNRLGLCLKCNYGRCQAKFYPTGARSARLFINLKAIGSLFQHKVYCGKHSVEQIIKVDSQHGAKGLKNIKQLRFDLCHRLQLRLKSLLDEATDTGWKYPGWFIQPHPPPSCGQHTSFYEPEVPPTLVV